MDDRLMRRVAVIPFPGIDNAFICLSGKRRNKYVSGPRWTKEAEHDKKDETRVEPAFSEGSDPYITFCYKNEDTGIAAEWDGEYGPIQRWFRCNEDYKSEDGGDKAIAHWLWPFAHGLGHWSQMAVSDAELPKAFIEGDYEYIFQVLKSWAD